MKKIIGIDLGTTNSVVAILEGNRPVVIPNDIGENLTPSVVALEPETGRWLVGEEARKQAVTNPHNTIFSVKRFIGRKYNTPEIDDDKRYSAYNIRSSRNGDVEVRFGNLYYPAQAIISILLSRLKSYAEDFVGEFIHETVISVPAYFNDAQRQAIRDAGEIAGLKVVRIINEPTAAALALGITQGIDEQTIAIYHLGGGTFDISILETGEGIYEVKATSGNSHLGGDDLDIAIVKWICDQIKEDHHIDLHQDQIALLRVILAAEEAKRLLSGGNTTEICIPNLSLNPKFDLKITLTRSKLEELTKDLLYETIITCKKAISDADIKPFDVDQVVLVGEQTRMPLVQLIVKEYFGKNTSRLVDASEAIAIGAAIQGGILAGNLKGYLLMDATAHTLLIETVGDEATPMISRNVTIPTKKSAVFTTAMDNQEVVEVKVLVGESKKADENIRLGDVRLQLRSLSKKVQSLPKERPQIEVTFDIDANGILAVEAKEIGSFREVKSDIIPYSGLSLENKLKLKQEITAEVAKQSSRKAFHSLQYDAHKLVKEIERILVHPPCELSSEIRKRAFKTKNMAVECLKAPDNETFRDTVNKLKEVIEELQLEAEKSRIKNTITWLNKEITNTPLDGYPKKLRQFVENEANDIRNRIDRILELDQIRELSRRTDVCRDIMQQQGEGNLKAVILCLSAFLAENNMAHLDLGFPKEVILEVSNNQGILFWLDILISTNEKSLEDFAIHVLEDLTGSTDRMLMPFHEEATRIRVIEDAITKIHHRGGEKDRYIALNLAQLFSKEIIEQVESFLIEQKKTDNKTHQLLSYVISSLNDELNEGDISQILCRAKFLVWAALWMEENKKLNTITILSNIYLLKKNELSDDTGEYLTEISGKCLLNEEAASRLQIYKENYEKEFCEFIINIVQKDGFDNLFLFLIDICLIHHKNLNAMESKIVCSAAELDQEKKLFLLACTALKKCWRDETVNILANHIEEGQLDKNFFSDVMKLLRKKLPENILPFLEQLSGRNIAPALYNQLVDELKKEKAVEVLFNLVKTENDTDIQIEIVKAMHETGDEKVERMLAKRTIFDRLLGRKKWMTKDLMKYLN